jgi:hypothetical protein
MTCNGGRQIIYALSPSKAALQRQTFIVCRGSGVCLSGGPPKRRAEGRLKPLQNPFPQIQDFECGISRIPNYWFLPIAGCDGAEIKQLYNAPGNATADRYVAPRSEDILK